MKMRRRIIDTDETMLAQSVKIKLKQIRGVAKKLSTDQT